MRIAQTQVVVTAEMDTENGAKVSVRQSTEAEEGLAAIYSRTTITAMPQTVCRHIGNYDSETHVQEWDFSQRISYVRNWNNKNLLTLSGELGYHHSRRQLQVVSDTVSRHSQ